VEVLSLGGDITYSIQQYLYDFLLGVSTKWAVVTEKIVEVFPDNFI
jgi:hypothetical protein